MTDFHDRKHSTDDRGSKPPTADATAPTAPESTRRDVVRRREAAGTPIPVLVNAGRVQSMGRTAVSERDLAVGRSVQPMDGSGFDGNSSGNRAGTSTARVVQRVATRSNEQVQRKALSDQELDELNEYNSDDKLNKQLGLAFHRHIVRKRSDLIDNATGAAFESVVKPHLVETYTKLLKDFYTSMVSGSTPVFVKAGAVAEQAIRADAERLASSGIDADTATGRYGQLRLLAANSGSSWDKGILFSDVRLALQNSAADKGIAAAALDQAELDSALENAHRQLRSAVEGRARAVVDGEKDYYQMAQGSRAGPLAAYLDEYHRADGTRQSDLGDLVRDVLANMKSSQSEAALSSALQRTVTEVTDFANAHAEAIKAPAYAGLKKTFDTWSISRREQFRNQAIRGAATSLADPVSAEQQGADAVKLVTEGYIHSGLASAAPAIDAIAGENDTNGKLKIAIEVPIHGAVIGFEFQCKVAKDATGKLSIAVDLGVSGGVGLPNLKAAIGAGMYLESSTKAGSAVLMDQVSLAFYRRFKDAGVPFTNSIWGLGGRTKQQGETDSEAKTREAEAFASMVEEQMGDEGEVETGGYVKGTLEAEAGEIAKGSLELKGTSGTLLDKKAFAETKDRKAARSGFSVTLSAGAGPFKGTLMGAITNTVYVKRSGDEDIETTGKFDANLNATVPGGAIYGNPAQTATQIGIWLAELVPKVRRLKEVIKKKDPGLGDVKMLYSLEEELREAGEAVSAGITGEWKEKAASFASESASKSLLTSSAGLTLGYTYKADKDGNGKGTVYLDLTKGNAINVGVAKIEYTSGERIFSKILSGGT